MKQKLLHHGLSLLTAAAALIGVVGQQSIALGATDSSGLDRTVLPIKEPTYPESTVLDARDAKAPPRFEVKAPAKAPNVVIVLIDDI
ncbi:MAG: arylsulfatase, partial [Verrucomicrobia bacterium]